MNSCAKAQTGGPRVNKLFLRREFLQFAGAAAVTLPARAQHSLPRSNVDGQATLDTGRWEEAARQRIEGVMRQLGAGSPGYDREHPPYAVSDWDNTSIANDTKEALSLFQIETLSFRIPPAQFAAVLRSGVPAGPLTLSGCGRLPSHRGNSMLVKIALSPDRRPDLL
jgi:hypothetical protein